MDVTTENGVAVAKDSGGNSLFAWLDRIFGLDAQLFADVTITLVSVFILFLLLSYLLFNPARELLAKRQAKVQADLDAAAQEKEDALQFKAEYMAKVEAADKEVDEILSEGRKKAMKREAEIITEAQEEAVRITQRANREIELEKNKMKDEVKKEMISVASMMAGKFVAESMDEKKQAQLVDEALNEIGDDTWRN
ncbi:MAG: F0F1 ATP synthase subunit B [Lachnospiraceae bacterium]|nr:F0F1 ATP synthase subunit B [Lachnospiraceae bacterium]